MRRLSVSGSGLSTHAAAKDLVVRAAAVAGDALLAVVLYGSWARGEAGPASDVDVLVVVDPARPLVRSLYDEWDRAPVRWDGRAIDPHFVHLPEAAPATGLWGEAAIDGVVLFEAGCRVSVLLAQVRRDIADGRLVRRTLHGQPYWVAA